MSATLELLGASACGVWLLIFLWRSFKFLRGGSSDGLEFALSLRCAAVYVLGICSIPLLFPCPDTSEGSWQSCPKSPWVFIPTNLMRIFHFLPFWYAFLITPYLGGLIAAFWDALAGVAIGLAAISMMNLLLPGGAAGTSYLPPEFFERAWLPFRYSSPAAFALALCFTYGLFVSKLSWGKKQYALGLFAELLVSFMSPNTRGGFRAVLYDWDFSWNWNGSAISGLWVALLAVLLSIPTMGLIPSRKSLRVHTATLASATALAELAEDTGGCLEYLMTILQQAAWKYRFHAESSQFYIMHLGLRRRRAEDLLTMAAWEPMSQNLQPVASFLRQLRQLLRIQSEQMRYFGEALPKGEQMKLEGFLSALNEALALVASDCRSQAALSQETRGEIGRIADKADEVLLETLRSLTQNDKTVLQMAFVEKFRSWPAALRDLAAPARPAAAKTSSDWAARNLFALRNSISWTLALFWSLYFRNYSCGCVVATSFIFSQTSGSSFDVNINRLLGTCMGLAVGNLPALLILHGAENLAMSSSSYLLRIFMYLVVVFTTWTLAIFGYVATDSKWKGACLMWAALSGVEMLRHLPRAGSVDVVLFTTILDNVLAVVVVFLVDIIFAYLQGNYASEQVKASVTRCIQRIASVMETLKASGISEVNLDDLQKDIKDARFWQTETQKEGLVWTRLLQHPYKAESVPSLLDHFDEVYVWLQALQNSASRLEPLVTQRIIQEALPKTVVERCQSFARAIKLVLQGLEDSLTDLFDLLEVSKAKDEAPSIERVSSKSICNMLQGDDAEGETIASGSSVGGDAAQRAAEEAVQLSCRALRMTLQKLGGLLSAGSALAAKDWGAVARQAVLAPAPGVSSHKETKETKEEGLRRRGASRDRAM